VDSIDFLVSLNGSFKREEMFEDGMLMMKEGIEVRSDSVSNQEWAAAARKKPHQAQYPPTTPHHSTEQSRV